MTVLESKRRARARRWLRGYIRAVEGKKDDPGAPRPGIQRRLFERWCKRAGVNEALF